MTPAVLVKRRHVDLLRVATAACPGSLSQVA
ncbi:putative leader peptide [Pseudonocardia sp. GCM10023141]